ncbi:Probable siderophore transport system ATP-binding protein YusV [Sebaldella termitidis]|uniref:ABC transporter related protein n=1 Tax=Sebaldella termitidis (strain ATCC 33386 / NCTC 11300) TaxID=526218 RepID=D1APU0_SEBTE|nr:metal ABC transporter ATP-binding protein [Sebaldella termitidis]ACZ10124.1 ABC transporter related protein [Sebaldella termitidis ATCC 33386]SUI25459.1 Probable siderophore transport system ATP-binding protein YusV [Sebaldella termitidis]
MRNNTAVSINDLTVAYDDKPVLWDIDLDIKKGTLMAIVGPNGAGKSTLIKAMLNLIKPITGCISFFGSSYKKERSKIAYVPQRGSVDWDFPTTALDVVEMGRYGKIGWIKRVGKSDRKIAVDAIKKVGMEGFEKRQISQLSGGQQQRIFLARALVQDAEIYFMDEPFQGVDAKTEKSIINILKKLRDKGKTVIVVHHDLQTVEEYFDYIAFINVAVISSGKVKEIFNRENIEKTYKNRSFTDFSLFGSD